MKLYIYDHCPYCVKARMIFGVKKVPFELVTLLNDEEKLPIKMIGKKMLPIIEKQQDDFMPESLDIIKFIDELAEYGKPIVESSKANPGLNRWLQDIRQYHYQLAMPRWPLMGLEEFATELAVQYFTRKKEKSIGLFKENMERSQDLIVQANRHLQELESMIVGEPYFWGEQLNIDDFHVFASLRCLTTTKGVVFPESINQYMNFLSEISQVPLHWDKAI